MRHTKLTVPFVLMGLVSILLQVTVLRLLLSTFSGNELDIGITLSFWLIYVGLGSFYGKTIKSQYAFTLSFILIAVFVIPTAFAIKAIRPILSLQPGEIVSLYSTILSTAVILFPICFMIGIQFPLAVSFSGERNAAGRLYGLEALGAFTGGVLFTLVLASRVNSFDLCLFLSFLNILIAIYVSKKRILYLFLLIPLSFYLGFHKTAMELPWHGLNIMRIEESRYGEIAVVKVDKQSSIYTNGHLIYTYPDIPTEEFKMHLPMSLHPSPSNILIIGGSLGNIKHLLKYDVQHIDFVEIDFKIIEISQEILEGQDEIQYVNDRRVRIIVEDGRRFVKRLKTPSYDLVFLNVPQPSTASTNRFYSIDFFREMNYVLKKDGILVLKLPKSTGYIGRSMQTANGAIYNSLKRVFKYVEVTAQEYGGFFASQSPIMTDPEILAEHFVNRKIPAEYFHQYMFYDAFSSFGMDYVRKRLGEIDHVNTDLRPSAYLYNLMVWAEVQGENVLKYLLDIRRWHLIVILALFLIVCAFIIFGRKDRVMYFSVFTTGFSSMSFTVAVILVYQSLYGYVYEVIGILIATFMLGLWAGTVITRYMKRALETLFSLEVITVIIALLSLLFFKAEVLFYVLIFVAGTVTGGQFHTANVTIGRNELAGRLYGLDLIGSFGGAIIPTIIVIPLLGVYDAFLCVAVVKAFSAIMIFFIMYKGRYKE